MWRGDLSPLGCVADPILGPLRSPAGMNPLATNSLLVEVRETCRQTPRPADR